jgi:stage II sporulation protein D
VALATRAPRARVGGTGEWRLYERTGRVVLRGVAAQEWTVESRSGGEVRAIPSSEANFPTAWRIAAFVARPIGIGAVLTYEGRRYRGELAFYPTDSGIVVVNRLPVEDYLRGVVPLEIGTRAPGDRAAIEAQAVAARSYAYAHITQAIDERLPGLGRERPPVRAGRERLYDVTGGVTDQVYGGMGAEQTVADGAVLSTARRVLTYNGAVVSAPYHSTCGGSTAEAQEVWRSGPEPYLRPVSDRVPGTDRFYCDIAPRFRWTRSLDRASLDVAVAKYLRSYVASAPADPGSVRGLQVESRTPSGRVGVLRVSTDRGSYALRGNDIRFVLRTPGGEILPSTYFSVDSDLKAVGDGRAAITLRGNGNGHGIGMCQWGAIGRARAGQSALDILRAYYPGAVVSRVD